ncbi:branched-chain amino acid ABC transporter permease [Castellaniella sp. GW247-6E4]|uniref:branched-chain amino acid ABC transporter permease n=1 Tax=Castellaniella sp. GW247-6E4 TaxID=3140380 RepID=UPI003315665F
MKVDATQHREGQVDGRKSSFGGSHRRAWTFIGLFALLALPLFLGEYTQYVVNRIVVTAIAIVGFNIALGYLGQLAFANVAFFGIGAYATAIVLGILHLPLELALVASALAGAIGGLIVSLPALRGIRGLYLAIITLAFGELLRWAYIYGGPVTQGANGIDVPGSTFLGFEMTTAFNQYYLFVGIGALMIWLTLVLLRSKFGRAIVAIRDSAVAATSLGISVPRYVIFTFCWSGCVTAVGGGLSAITVGRVIPDMFDMGALINQFAMVMVGGLGSIGGSVLGAIVLGIVPDLLSAYPGTAEVVTSTVMILVLLFLPRGLISLWGGRGSKRYAYFYKEPV